MQKAQVAMEYILIIGFALLIAIPLFLLFNFYTVEARNEVTINQADSIARKIVDSAETVYYLGEPSKITIKVYMPTNIENLTINDGNVWFKIKIGEHPIDVVQSSEVNITGNVSYKAGVKNINVESKGDYVWVYNT